MEKRLAQKIAEANDTTIRKMGLRFDRVVLRLAENMDAFSRELPGGWVVLVTISAPIKVPAKTEEALKEKIRASLNSVKTPVRSVDLHENEIRLRLLSRPANQKSAIQTLVHSDTANAENILNLVADWMDENPAS